MKQTILFCLLLAGLVANAQVPCKGITKAGNPCKSKMVNKETGYCHAHNPNKPKLTPAQIKWKKFNRCVGEEITDFRCDSCYKAIILTK